MKPEYEKMEKDQEKLNNEFIEQQNIEAWEDSNRQDYLDYSFKTPETNYMITINSPCGKKLNLDFNTGKLKTSGDLEIDKASKLFIESLDCFFQELIKKQVEKKLEEIKNE